jgi:delta11-fatty-acid desaturase
MGAFFATLPAYFRGAWWALVAMPVLAWVVIANYWHDGLHFSLSCDWRVNATLPYLFPWLSSPWLWYHQHVIGHHCYTNVAHKDPDLAHAPQLIREHDSIKWRPTHATQELWSRVLLVWSVAVGAGLQILSDVRANTKGTYNNAVPLKLMERARFHAHTLGRLFYVASLFVWPWACLPL